VLCRNGLDIPVFFTQHFSTWIQGTLVTANFLANVRILGVMSIKYNILIYDQMLGCSDFSGFDHLCIPNKGQAGSAHKQPPYCEH